MFSVDNFYDVFRAHYSWPRTENVMFQFKPHGSRDLADLAAQVSDQRYHDLSELYTKSFSDTTRNQWSRVIMHDQEPIDIDAFSTYRDHFDGGKEPDYAVLLENCTNPELMIARIKGSGYPILCHSEINSDDVTKMCQVGMIPCYYWWHGLIARDWFRHWQHHPDLRVNLDHMHAHRFLLYCRATDGSRAYRASILEDIRVLRNTVLWNPQSAVTVPATASAHIEIPDARSAAVHVVAETVFESSKIFLTEKVFKPMVMNQPFLLFAGPGSLSLLRRYGFRTFDDCWDESYDLEQDPRRRYQMVMKVWRDLDSVGSRQFRQIWQQTRSAVEHNQRWFFSKEFGDLLWDELQHNMSEAMREQFVQNQDGQGAWQDLCQRLQSRNVPLSKRWQALQM